jgi:hypothetical protein
MLNYFHGGAGPSGVGIEVEFPLVILPVMLPAIVLLLAVWLPWLVCASADSKFIYASILATNIPIATIVTPNLKLFFMWCYMIRSIYLKITTRLISGQR